MKLQHLSVMATTVLAACRVIPLDVGDDPSPVDAGSDAAEASDVTAPMLPATLAERLRARCAEQPGPDDPYVSARELTARLVGRWFNCDPPERSPIQDGLRDGVAFDADGRWALLVWNDARDALDRSTSDTQHGVVRYHAFTDPDAGTAAEGGVGSSDVARDDPGLRNGLVVYLDRSGPDPQSFTFGRAPRQMTAVELGPSALRARYVPVD